MVLEILSSIITFSVNYVYGFVLCITQACVKIKYLKISSGVFFTLAFLRIENNHSCLCRRKVFLYGLVK